MKKHKWLVSIFLVITILVSYSSTIFASNYNITNIDREFMSDFISDIAYINSVLEPLGITFNDFLNLFEKDTLFYNELEGYINSLDIEPSEYETSILESLSSESSDHRENANLLGNRIGYASYIANENKKIDSNAKDLETETVYMYLSHYIDVSDPSVVTPVDYNSHDGYFSAWITNDDRTTYDTYMSKGSAINTSRNLKRVVSGVISIYSNNTNYQGIFNALKEQENISKDLYNDLIPVIDDVDTLKDIIPSIFDLFNQSETAEDYIIRLNNDLGLENYDINVSRTIIKATITGILAYASGGVSIVLSPVFSSLAGDAVGELTSISFNMYKDFYDYVNWLSLSLYRNMRVVNRMYRAWGY
ncbi:hypothetical protein [Anaerosalibacter sp. Marseille-P3206]|uniref:hypothetical protein n=1 Tax=Anaerosalibacter sp. Marseille-P3206 TaxID=1871005 RepID=UPI0009871A34|nr:hypothetical protein [Anaerosalibacter sp. Marseille-P3206]